jgi:DNA-binding GntR family transcriptional regulator
MQLARTQPEDASQRHRARTSSEVTGQEWVTVTDDLGAKAPKYQRIASTLRTDIRTGTYGPGDRLPAETALMERFKVSLPTLRQAIGLLRAEGLLESRHGIGTFVREDRRLTRRSRHRYDAARGRAGLLNAHLRHEITFAGRDPLPERIAEVMGLSTGDEVVIRRRNLYDRETGRLEEIGASYLPLSVAGGTFLEKPAVVPKALFRCVEEFTGRRYTTALDRWVARLATGEEAGAFDLPTGAPVLHVIHTARDENGDVLEVSESIWPADRVVFLDEYDIPADADPQDLKESQI